jgi:hypothetical protein
MGRLSPGAFLLELDKLYAKQKGSGSVYVEMKRSTHHLVLFVSLNWLEVALDAIPLQQWNSCTLCSELSEQIME